MSRYSSESDSSCENSRSRRRAGKSSRRSRSSSDSSSDSHYSYKKKSYKHKRSKGHRSRSRDRHGKSRSRHHGRSGDDHSRSSFRSRSSSKGRSRRSSRDRSHSRGRSKSRERRSRSKERSRRRSRSGSRDWGRYRSRSHSRSGSKNYSNSPVKRKSRSRSRSASKQRSHSQSSHDSRTQSMPKQEPSTEEQLRVKLQKAIKAAQSADDQLRQQGLLTGTSSRKEDLFKETAMPSAPHGSVLDEINDSSFVQKHFTSSKHSIPKSTEAPLIDLTGESISISAVPKEDPKSIFHPNEFGNIIKQSAVFNEASEYSPQHANIVSEDSGSSTTVLSPDTNSMKQLILPRKTFGVEKTGQYLKSLENAIQALQSLSAPKEEDEIDAFCKSINLQMRKLPEEVVSGLMADIQTLVSNTRGYSKQQCLITENEDCSPLYLRNNVNLNYQLQ